MAHPPHVGFGAARFVGAVFGFVFAAIGVTVIVFLWGAPSDEWDSPPLFFRIFGSLIALVFVAVGGSMGIAALRAKSASVMPDHVARGPESAGTGDSAGLGELGRGGYACPNCGAPLGASAEVSPSGDVKCAFCGRWFNVHRSA